MRLSKEAAEIKAQVFEHYKSEMKTVLDLSISDQTKALIAEREEAMAEAATLENRILELCAEGKKITGELSEEAEKTRSRLLKGQFNKIPLGTRAEKRHKLEDLAEVTDEVEDMLLRSKDRIKGIKRKVSDDFYSTVLSTKRTYELQANCLLMHIEALIEAWDAVVNQVGQDIGAVSVSSNTQISLPPGSLVRERLPLSSWGREEPVEVSHDAKRFLSGI